MLKVQGLKKDLLLTRDIFNQGLTDPGLTNPGFHKEQPTRVLEVHDLHGVRPVAVAVGGVAVPADQHGVPGS